MCSLNSTGRGEVFIRPLFIPFGAVAEIDIHWYCNLCLSRRDIVVHRDKLLGSGAAGLVYKGRYREQDVAIKVGQGG